MSVTTDARKIRDTLASTPDWLTRTILMQKCVLKASELDDAVALLEVRDQIMQTKAGRRGTKYRLTNRGQVQAENNPVPEPEMLMAAIYKFREDPWSAEEMLKGQRIAMQKCIDKLEAGDVSDTMMLKYIELLIDANDRFIANLQALMEAPSIQRFQIEQAKPDTQEHQHLHLPTGMDLGALLTTPPSEATEEDVYEDE